MIVNTLCLLLRDKTHHPTVLLALKKRGHGAGKRNAPGGKPEAGESLEQAVTREVWAEVYLDIKEEDLQKVAIINFFFGGKLEQEVHIFLAEEWQGNLQESEEMGDPRWYDTMHMPWSEMWASDQGWMLPVLSGEKINWDIYYSIDGETVERIVKHEVCF